MREWWGNVADKDDNVEEQWVFSPQKIGGGNSWKEYWQIRWLAPSLHLDFEGCGRVSGSLWAREAEEAMSSRTAQGLLKQGGWGTIQEVEDGRWSQSQHQSFEVIKGGWLGNKQHIGQWGGEKSEYLHKHFTFLFGIFCGKSVAIPWGPIALLWHCLWSSSWLTVTKHFQR